MADKVAKDEMRIDELVDGLIDPNAPEEDFGASGSDDEDDLDIDADEDEDGDDGAAACFRIA
jgi:RNA polymerase primary sigma factor